MLGREDIDTFSSMNNLGVLLENLGKHEEAEAMHRQCIEAMEKSLINVSNLSFVLGHLRSYKGAEAGDRRAPKEFQKILWRKDSMTLGIIHNPGWLLGKQDMHDEAEGMHLRKREIDGARASRHACQLQQPWLDFW